MLYAIGVGVNATAHVTDEARRAIRACRAIFVLAPDAGVLDLVRKINPVAQVVDCRRYYEGETSRPSVYWRIASAVIEKASPYTNTALVVYGNPMFLVSAVERLLEQAEKRGLRTKVIAGLSSFDTVLAELRVDLGYGVTTIDATLLMQNKFTLDLRLPLLIFQVANLDSDDVEPHDIPVDRLERLLSFLTGRYPSSHPCSLVVSRKDALEEGYVIDSTLDNLASDPRVCLTDRPTLYVPGVSYC